MSVFIVNTCSYLYESMCSTEKMVESCVKLLFFMFEL